MNVCAFCGPTTEDLSAEDIFPVWLSKLYRRDFRFRVFHHYTAFKSVDQPLRESSQRLNLRAPVVCKPCNNEWMSQIENLAKPILIPLITKPNAPRRLDDEQSSALILWVTLKAIVLDHLDVLSNRNSRPFFQPHERARFKHDWILPNRTSIWFGRLTTRDTDTGRLLSTYSAFPGFPTLKHLEAYVMTLSVRELVVQALFLKNARRPRPGALSAVPEHMFAIQPKKGAWSQFLVQIYPDVGDVCWPPLLQFGNRGFEALAYRISGKV